jgi:hypothetical protein
MYQDKFYSTNDSAAILSLRAAAGAIYTAATIGPRNAFHYTASFPSLGGGGDDDQSGGNRRGGIGNHHHNSASAGHHHSNNTSHHNASSVHHHNHNGGHHISNGGGGGHHRAGWRLDSGRQQRQRKTSVDEDIWRWTFEAH